MWRSSTRRTAIRRPSQRSSAARTRRTPAIADVRDEGRPAVGPGVAAPLDPLGERPHDARSRRGRRRDGPIPRTRARRCPGDTGRSCPRTRPPRRRSPVRRRTARPHAAGPTIDAGRFAPTNPDGSRPAPTSRCRSQPEVVDLPCVPVTPMSRRPPVAAASAMICWTLSGTIPTARAATSSGWSGWTEVIALVTARRSTTAPPSVARTCAASWRQSIGMPAARTAAGHGIGPTRVAGGHDRADGRRVERGARRGGATDPDDVDPRAGRDRRRVPRRREAAGDVLVGAGHSAGVPGRCQGIGPLGEESERRGRARLVVGRPVAGPVEATHVRPESIADADVDEPDGLLRASRHPARRRPVIPTPRSAPSRSRTPAAIASATCALTAPCVARTSGGTPSAVDLHARSRSSRSPPRK